jgi:hypothetical protein
MVDKETIYQYDDSLLFSVVKPMLADWDNGDEQRRVVFLCPKHKLKLTDVGLGKRAPEGYKLVCPMCQRDVDYSSTAQSSKYSLKTMESRALALYDKDIYQDAKLVRLDDYYVPEIKKFDALPGSSDYSIKADVKTDKDGDTIVVLYVGYKGEKEKTQLFIKPEKLQLSHDHKDLDPAKILSRIEITLKDRSISQQYGDSDE